MFSSSGGPLQVSYPNWANAISSWFALGLNELGLRPLTGFTNGSLIGWSYVANTLDPKFQIRSSSETSFLRDSLLKTTNLALYQSTLAKQIVFQDGKATQISLDSRGTAYTIAANKEIIVSAGTVSISSLFLHIDFQVSLRMSRSSVLRNF